MYRHNGIKVKDRDSVVVNGQRYHNKFLDGMTATQRTALGIETVADIARPDHLTHKDIVENDDGSYTSTLKTQGELNRESRRSHNEELSILTSVAGSYAIDLFEANTFTCTLTENTNLALPANAEAGQVGHIRFIQDAATAFVLTFDTSWVAATGTAGVMSTTLGASNVMTYVVEVGGATPVITYGWATKGIA